MLKPLLSLCLICMIHTAKAQDLSTFNWLKGQWKTTGKNHSIIESWAADGNTFNGTSFKFLSEKDSTLLEKMKIGYNNENLLVFKPTAVGQNDNQPTEFAIIFYSNSEFICENPKHDFPQRISYRRINNQLYASIEGYKNGKYLKRNFDFMLVNK